MSSTPIAWNKLPELAQLLRDSRLKSGLTQEQVADVLGINPGLYMRFELGNTMPNSTTLKKACELLGLDYQAVVAQMPPDNDDLLF